VDCSIAFKYGTKFHHITGDKNVHKRSRSKVKVTGLKFKTMSQRTEMFMQQKRYNTIVDRLSDFTLGMAS